MAEHVNNKVLGAGKLYFDVEDDDGNLTGERYMGDTPGFSINISTTKVEDFSSDGPIAEKDLSVTTQVTRSATIQCKDVSPENQALFVIADVNSLTQEATPVSDELIGPVKQGRWYQLGVSDAMPTGIRSVGTVTITDTQQTPTEFTAGTDYELDAALGRIYIIPGGGIDDDTSLQGSYTPAAGTRTQVVSNQTGPKFGALRFVADNTTGRNDDLYAPRVQLTPNGDFAIKSRDTVQQMTFQTDFLVKAGRAALYIDGQAVTT